MRKEILTELLKMIMECVGEERITVRRVGGEDGDYGIIIAIGTDKLPDKES